MDYLQYMDTVMLELDMQTGFKPYYKWITFNTLVHLVLQYLLLRFKPYYKWITFNTTSIVSVVLGYEEF